MGKIITETYVIVAKSLGVVEGRLGLHDDVPEQSLVVELDDIEVAVELLGGEAAGIRPLGRRAQALALRRHCRRRGTVHRDRE